MAKIIISTGPTSSGKTRAAREWKKAGEGRVIVRSTWALMDALGLGVEEIWLDSDELAGQDFELRRFPNTVGDVVEFEGPNGELYSAKVEG